MNNQNGLGGGKKHRIFKGKVVWGVAMLVVILGATAYLASSKNARGLLGQSGAIAIKSFANVFMPNASDTLVSEIDLTSRSLLNATGAGSREISSAASETAAQQVGGNFSAPQDAQKNKPVVRDDIAVKNQNDKSADPTRTASDPRAPVVPPKLPSATEDASADISAQELNKNVSADNSPVCSFPSSVPTTIVRRVILNEIAWMGTPTTTGETADHAANREWMELRNISGAEISLDGWRIMDAGGTITISFGAGDAIAPNGFYLLSRGGNFIEGISSDKAYTGILPNNGDKLVVLDTSCGVSDFIDASAKWPAGSNTTKQTLERTASLGWQTSTMAGGTPRRENSAGAPAAVILSSSTEKYELDVTIAGDGGGTVTVKPTTTTCKASCVNHYTKGTVVTLAASPGNGASFIGWSGGCAGTSACSFIIGGPVSVIAEFRLNADRYLMIDNNNDLDASNTENIQENATSSLSESTSTATSSSSVEDGNNESPTSSPPAENGIDASSSSLPAPRHLVLAAIQIAGAATSDDFVKIYNPTQSDVTIGGWKLRKKSSTGTDSSLREFPAESVIAAGGYFTWASSANGFAQSIGADVSSTGTLAVNNSVALLTNDGTQVDAVAWGNGANQYVEGAPYPENPGANQALQRKFIDGVVVDTDNNNNDFTL